jgi:hypothetical protein
LNTQLEMLSEITRQALSNKDDFWKAAGDSMETMLQGTATGLSDVIVTGASRSIEDLAFRLEDVVEAVRIWRRTQIGVGVLISFVSL